MRTTSFALAALALAVSFVHPAGAGGPAQPVVVELFTSEGCSSCPPADAVLDRLAREQPVAGAEVIALELHVDYWNHLGWTDPFSQAAFSARQNDYARVFSQRGAYTPQLVVDGQREMVGSRGRDAEDAIAEASRAPRAKVVLSRDGDKLTIAVDGIPDVAADEGVNVWLAVTEGGLSTRVLRGENGGATLAHGPVVRELRRVSAVGPHVHGPVRVTNVDVLMDPAWKRENVRAAAFVQRERSLQILGAGVVSMK
jgi:hypothetical protein